MENDEQTFTKTIKSRKRRQRMKLQPQSEQIEQASEVELTAQLDEVDSEQLSNLNDVIKSDVDLGGQQDLIADGSSDDSDLLDASTNNAFESLAPLTRPPSTRSEISKPSSLSRQ